MTIFEIKNALVSWFLEKNMFDIDTDIKSLDIEWPSEFTETTIRASCRVCLEQLAEGKYVTQLGELPKWLLTQPLTLRVQNVEISQPAASEISRIINVYRDTNGIQDGMSDALQITENDIRNLIAICHDLVQTKTSDTNGETDE